ncbi:sensor histidine kinase [Streptomyces alfalfae]|uniref:Signal transduction histidine-protein kinase/phosphatase MprB n=1 Tax=Streptomyces alfalfae TaxID=1642299 RepID=A0A1P8TRJ4_9ACTN|nr:HAMP domain-containing sensor histidine kinase [Streptomyces alfalfae]AYA20715.1 sensor histidine kinase [Streptomyces fradiae]APY90256.1 two-component sensor histidine kinase [Streptomyces alfalfae]QQC87224.1 HAMP domain-containing histidine kinase [Streptomyces alfalfae]RXX34922.1 sensor histidine kinase [Streptomyces alfalfae]RZM98027.1 sensor histidine kinase [Streptomyces alfalfae]
MTVPHSPSRLRRLTDPRSLRWQVAAGVTVAAFLMALGIGVLVHRTTESRSLALARADALHQLDEEEDAQAERDRQPDGADSESGLVVGDKVPDEVHRRLGGAAGPVTWYEVRGTADQAAMWAGTRIDGTVVAVRHDMISDLLNRRALDRHMRYAALATLAVVVPLSALAAELVLRRLRRIAGTAHRIREGDLDARTRTRRRDEIGQISSAVDHMADVLQERLHSEQRFTADVAHELRTPVAGLVTAASLLPESEATDLVRDRVRVLHGLVDDLLEVSRLDAGTERADIQPLPLADLVRECVARTGGDVRLTVVGRPVVRTDPRRLDRILTNLLLNAQRHGEPPVEVEVRGATLAVRDHGPGFPPDLLAHGPQRFRTATPERGRGHGLGLTIAQAQAEVLGARLTLTNTAPRGARAVLELPASSANPGP